MAGHRVVNSGARGRTPSRPAGSTVRGGGVGTAACGGGELEGELGRRGCGRGARWPGLVPLRNRRLISRVISRATSRAASGDCVCAQAAKPPASTRSRPFRWRPSPPAPRPRPRAVEEATPTCGMASRNRWAVGGGKRAVGSGRWAVGRTSHVWLLAREGAAEQRRSVSCAQSCPPLSSACHRAR